jgi:hypothetical protein
VSLIFTLTLASLALAGKHDVIDLQWSLCEGSSELAAQKLGLEEAAEASITYFENEPIRYLFKGIAFRLKQNNQREGTSSLKVRQLSEAKPMGEDCQWDRYGAARYFTCEVRGKNATTEDPWTKKQKIFAEEVEPIDWSNLKPFGPYRLRKWGGQAEGLKLVLDSVELPGNYQPIIEASVKVPIPEEHSAQRAISALLKRQSVSLCEIQEPKTQRIFRALGLL